jgi:hypothetical protein
MSSTTTTDSEATNDRDHDVVAKEWIRYQQCVQKYWLNAIVTATVDPSYFTNPHDYQYYLQCCSCPLPLICSIPPIVLPLHVYICRNTKSFQCSSDLNPTTILDIIKETNETYWTKYANIVFECTSDTIFDVSLGDTLQKEQHEYYIESIYQSKRNPRRRTLADYHPINHKTYHQFVRDTIMSYSREKKSNPSAISICFLDCIGHTLQGVCLSSPKSVAPIHFYNHNVNKKSTKQLEGIRSKPQPTTALPSIILIGERSNKGYINFTKRPHTCLAKTLGHELGHALSLKHIRNQTFRNTNIRKNCSNIPNLMEGGQDVLGGGGYYLEQWQICMARETAAQFF